MHTRRCGPWAGTRAASVGSAGGAGASSRSLPGRPITCSELLDLMPEVPGRRCTFCKIERPFCYCGWVHRARVKTGDGMHGSVLSDVGFARGSAMISLVGVVGGGPGPEREGSLASARDVSSALTQLGIAHEVLDLSSITGADLTRFAKLILVTHGIAGEDGTLQGYLDTLGIPYSGSGVLASALLMHKPTANLLAEGFGLRVPTTVQLRFDAGEQEIARALAKVGEDAILRPSAGGGSRGILRSGDIAAIQAHMQSLRDAFDDYLLSSFVEGVEVTSAFVETDREVQAFPLLATFHDGDFYDYDIKHDESSRRHACPAPIPAEAELRILEAAPVLYRGLTLRGYARFDFIVDNRGIPWFLEVNTLPGMSRIGNLATMAQSSGMSYEDLVMSVLDGIPSTMRSGK